MARLPCVGGESSVSATCGRPAVLRAAWSRGAPSSGFACGPPFTGRSAGRQDSRGGGRHQCVCAPRLKATTPVGKTPASKQHDHDTCHSHWFGSGSGTSCAGSMNRFAASAMPMPTGRAEKSRTLPHPEKTLIPIRPGSTSMPLSSSATSPSTSLASTVLSRKGIGKINEGKTGAGDTLTRKGIGKPAASKSKDWMTLPSSSTQAYHKKGPLQHCPHPSGLDHHRHLKDSPGHGNIDEYHDMPGLVDDTGISHSDARASSSTLDDNTKHVDIKPHGKSQKRTYPLL